MAAFVFLCNLNTEQECLERSLFGTTPGQSHQLHYSTIAIGDTLFLYNLDTGTMRGPFFALTRCTMNIVPEAWKKSTRRFFPWQVRVNADQCSKVPLGIDALSRVVPLTPTSVGLMPPASLEPEQEAAILEALRA